MTDATTAAQSIPLRAAELALAQATTIDAVVTALRHAARAIAGADGITVIRWIGDEVEYVGEDAISPLWTGQRFPIRTCVSGMAMLARDVIVIPDIENDPRVPLNAYLSTFVRSMAMFPIGRGDPDMAMGAYWRETGPVDAGAIARMASLAQVAADAVARIKAAANAAQDGGRLVANASIRALSTAPEHR
ncbi:GAF domain-containing protein [Sphingomonas sp.]|uniref:GAF domain-containing protein n=1 Tax=Sphingomonas sp. TaxID=28214 RepID=UPI002C380229|nr:GAF domain-containing protein [Sphingomonas sp.]HWK35910.1 GAF domain-containing protein [Sphingomonas sp.]